MTSVRRFRRPRWGLTLIEASVATAVVGLLAVAALNALGAGARTALIADEQATARLLAQELVAEIGFRAMPLGTTLTPGAGVDRMAWTDLGAYAGFVDDPPARVDGTPIEGAGAWRRTVNLSWVEPGEPQTPVARRTGLLRADITVERAGKVVARVSVLRSDTLDTLRSLP